MFEQKGYGGELPSLPGLPAMGAPPQQQQPPQPPPPPPPEPLSASEEIRRQRLSNSDAMTDDQLASGQINAMNHQQMKGMISAELKPLMAKKDAWAKFAKEQAKQQAMDAAALQEGIQGVHGTTRAQRFPQTVGTFTDPVSGESHHFFQNTDGKWTQIKPAERQEVPMASGWANSQVMQPAPEPAGAGASAEPAPRQESWLDWMSRKMGGKPFPPPPRGSMQESISKGLREAGKGLRQIGGDFDQDEPPVPAQQTPIDELAAVIGTRRAGRGGGGGPDFQHDPPEPVEPSQEMEPSSTIPGGIEKPAPPQSHVMTIREGGRTRNVQFTQLQDGTWHSAEDPVPPRGERDEWGRPTGPQGGGGNDMISEFVRRAEAAIPRLPANANAHMHLHRQEAVQRLVHLQMARKSQAEEARHRENAQHAEHEYLGKARQELHKQQLELDKQKLEYQFGLKGKENEQKADLKKGTREDKDHVHGLVTHYGNLYEKKVAAWQKDPENLGEGGKTKPLPPELKDKQKWVQEQANTHLDTAEAVRGARKEGGTGGGPPPDPEAARKQAQALKDLQDTWKEKSAGGGGKAPDLTAPGVVGHERAGELLPILQNGMTAYANEAAKKGEYIGDLFAHNRMTYMRDILQKGHQERRNLTKGEQSDYERHHRALDAMLRASGYNADRLKLVEEPEKPKE